MIREKEKKKSMPRVISPEQVYTCHNTGLRVSAIAKLPTDNKIFPLPYAESRSHTWLFIVMMGPVRKEPMPPLQRIAGTINYSTCGEGIMRDNVEYPDRISLTFGREFSGNCPSLKLSECVSSTFHPPLFLPPV